MVAANSWSSYRKKVWARTRADIREFAEQKGLATGASALAAGVAIAVITEWSMSAHAFSWATLVAGLIGAFGGPAVAYLASLLFLRFRVPYHLDLERVEDIERKKSASQKALDDLNKKHAQE